MFGYIAKSKVALFVALLGVVPLGLMVCAGAKRAEAGPSAPYGWFVNHTDSRVKLSYRYSYERAWRGLPDGVPGNTKLNVAYRSTGFTLRVQYGEGTRDIPVTVRRGAANPAFVVHWNGPN
jgi:hypothetical protein